MNNKSRYAATWSGGKDSCYACHRAIAQGKNVSHLVHFDRPVNLHGVSAEVIGLQAGLTGIPLVLRRVRNEEFEQDFRKTILDLKERDGITGMVFGDIYLEPHREWIERTCEELGIEAVLPLWGKDTRQLADEILSAGFETIIVSGRERIIDKQWIGRKMDGEFIAYLKRQGLDVCGENGEFHTLVVGGPLFRGRLEIGADGIVSRAGHWFLNIRGFSAHGRSVPVGEGVVNGAIIRRGEQ